MFWTEIWQGIDWQAGTRQASWASAPAAGRLDAELGYSLAPGVLENATREGGRE